MPSQCSMAKTVVAFSVAPLSPCSTGRTGLVCTPSASAVRLANNGRGPFVPELAAEFNRAALDLKIQVVEMADASNIDALGRAGAFNGTFLHLDIRFFAHCRSGQVFASVQIATTVARLWAHFADRRSLRSRDRGAPPV